jgi:hypothetical protein
MLPDFNQHTEQEKKDHSALAERLAEVEKVTNNNTKEISAT